MGLTQSHEKVHSHIHLERTLALMICCCIPPIGLNTICAGYLTKDHKLEQAAVRIGAFQLALTLVPAVVIWSIFGGVYGSYKRGLLEMEAWGEVVLILVCSLV